MTKFSQLTALVPARRRFGMVDAADRLALVASAACLVHCLALPLLFAVLPVLSQAFSLPESFHLWMVVVAVPTSTYALLAGPRDHHRRPLLVGAVGLGLLVIGTALVGESRYETPVTIMGALTLATAHVLNWRRRHRHRTISSTSGAKI